MRTPRQHHASLAFTVLALLLCLGGLTTAKAQCTVPYQLTNGQVADATQVMANINAVLACLNGAAPAGSTNALQYNAGSGSFGGVGPLTNGQVVIGSTGNAPQAATLSAGSGVTITNGAGSVTISAIGGGGSGLYNQVLSTTPTSSSSGLATWVNQGSASVADRATGVTISAPNGSGDNWRGRTKPAPATPYTITVLVARAQNASSPTAIAALGWYDGTAKLHLLSHLISSASTYIQVPKYNSPTSFNGTDFSTQQPISSPVWLRVSDDGTNVSFAYSMDGANFQTLYSVAKTSGFLGSTGYSNVGVFVDPINTDTDLTVMSYTEN